MIYDFGNGNQLWNFAMAMPPDDERPFPVKVLCKSGQVFAAIPSESFENMSVEARPITDPEAAWTDIIDTPLALTPFINAVPQPFELRISTEPDAEGRNMFGLYVGVPLA